MKPLDRTRLAALPVVLVALAAGAAIGLDAVYGGSAKPAPPIGVSTAVRYAYVEPTVTPTLPPGAPTPRPVPTFAPGVAGDPAERDQERRLDLIRLAGAADAVRADTGAYPTTGNNVQTICAYQNADVGCAFADVLGEIPIDPLGDPIRNGYWYSSDGQTARFYASLEGDVPESELCDTDDVELGKHANVICIELP